MQRWSWLVEFVRRKTHGERATGAIQFGRKRRPVNPNRSTSTDQPINRLSRLTRPPQADPT
jgi:hypothetical protein